MGHKKKKKGHGDGHGGNHERWLITYADMITLLMAFFIMMYSMSVTNLAKFQEVAFSIRSGFGGALRGAGAGGDHSFLDKSGGSTHDALHPRKSQKPGMWNSAAGFRRQPGPDGKTGQGTDDGSGLGAGNLEAEINAFLFLDNVARLVRVRRDLRGLVVSVASDELLFEPGRAELRPKAVTFLSGLAGILALADSEVLVEGHTDTSPVRSERFPSNWELSAARASGVARFLEDHGIGGRRLTAVGYGATRPILDSEDVGARSVNRRVDIVILSDTAGALAFSGPPLAPRAGGSPGARPRLKPSLTKVWERTP